METDFPGLGASAKISRYRPGIFLVKVISFFLCQRVAQIFPGGGFDIYGYWGEIQKVPSLPINATVAVFLHLVFEENESGAHLLTVKVIDPNKNILAKADGPVTIVKTSPEFVGPVVLGPLAIEHPGCYRLTLEIDKVYRIERQVVVEMVGRS